MGSVRVFRVVAVLVLVLGMVALLSPAPVRAASSPASSDILHEVLPGDCLHLIAGYYYGDARLWERIWKANREIVRNPHVLGLGSYVLVPEAGSPAEPYPDFTARAIGCGPAGAARASAERTGNKTETASSKAPPPSKAR